MNFSNSVFIHILYSCRWKKEGQENKTNFEDMHLKDIKKILIKFW